MVGESTRRFGIRITWNGKQSKQSLSESVLFQGHTRIKVGNRNNPKETINDYVNDIWKLDKIF